jgi:hypothetical protein
VFPNRIGIGAGFDDGTVAPGYSLDVRDNNVFQARFQRISTGDEVVIGASGNRPTVSMSDGGGNYGGMLMEGGRLTFRVNSPDPGLSDEADALNFDTARNVTIGTLAGSGTRMVTADASGTLSTQAAYAAVRATLDPGSPTDINNATIEPEWVEDFSVGTGITVLPSTPATENQWIEVSESGTYRVTINIRCTGSNRVELIVTPRWWDNSAAGVVTNLVDDIHSTYALRDVNQNTGGLGYSFLVQLDSFDRIGMQVTGDCLGTGTFITSVGSTFTVERVA